MKNFLLNFLCIITSFTALPFGLNAQIQTQPESRGICPFVARTYIAIRDSTNQFLWTVSASEGTIIGPNNTQSVTIIWADKRGQSTLNLKATKGDGTEVNFSLKEKIRSLKDKTVSPITGTGNVPFCSNTSIMYSIPKMTYNDSGLPNEFVEQYEWVIPSGWRYSGGPISDGSTPYRTISEAITVIPDNCSGNGGSIKVRGFNLCNLASPSQWSPSTFINRAPSTPTITMTPANYIAKCEDRTTLTFTSTAPSCATSFTWQVPSGWQILSGSGTRTITVRPDGVSGGNVNAIIGICGVNISSTLKNIQFDPSVSLPQLVPNSTVLNGNAITLCNGESSSMTVNVAGNPRTYSFTTTGGILINGTSSGSVTFPNGTSSWNFNVNAPSSGTGRGSITITAQNICGGQNSSTFSISYGTISSNDLSINIDGCVGCSTISCGTHEAIAFFYSSIFPLEAILEYQWRISSNWTITSGTTNQRKIFFSTPTNFSSNGWLEVRVRNRCGWGSWAGIDLYADCGGSGHRKISNNMAEYQVDLLKIQPNPSSDVFTLTFSNQTDFSKNNTNSIKIFDLLGREVYWQQVLFNEPINIQTSEFQNGVYLICLFEKNAIISQQKLIISKN